MIKIRLFLVIAIVFGVLIFYRFSNVELKPVLTPQDAVEIKAAEIKRPNPTHQLDLSPTLIAVRRAGDRMEKNRLLHPLKSEEALERRHLLVHQLLVEGSRQNSSVPNKVND